MTNNERHCSQFKIGDRVVNISDEVGNVVCVAEDRKGGFCYCVVYDFDTTRTFLNVEQSLRKV